jgi:serine/threonine protein kinase
MQSVINYTEEIKSIPEKLKLSGGDPLQLRSGSYRIVAEIGRGGFAHVYSLQDQHGKTYAIKILDMWTVRPNEYETLLAKFKQEYNVGQVHSTAIARSYFTGHIAGNPYIIMEYCPKGSLAKRLQDFHSPDRFESLGLTILNGLMDLHREGIIHRDLKPENILFDKEDCPKLTDFGISGHLNSRQTTRNIIGMVRQVWGTPLYCPPEQLSHQKAYKHTAPAMDIFSFGVLMYEVISGGHHPYGDHKELLENTNKYLDKVNARSIIPLTRYRRDVPSRWVDIIDRCLEPKPQNRFSSVEEIIMMLGKGIVASRPEPIEALDSNTDHAILKVMEGDNVGHVYYLAPVLAAKKGSALSIGWSDPDSPSLNDIPLTENSTRFISRQHATIIREPEGWTLMDGQWSAMDARDKESTNGTFVNFEQIPTKTKCQLKNGDIISIGNVRLKFMLL